MASDETSARGGRARDDQGTAARAGRARPGDRGDRYTHSSRRSVPTLGRRARRSCPAPAGRRR